MEIPVKPPRIAKLGIAVLFLLIVACEEEDYRNVKFQYSYSLGQAYCAEDWEEYRRTLDFFNEFTDSRVLVGLEMNLTWADVLDAIEFRANEPDSSVVGFDRTEADRKRDRACLARARENGPPSLP